MQLHISLSQKKSAYFPFEPHKILASTDALQKVSQYKVPFHKERLMSLVLNTAPASFI